MPFGDHHNFENDDVVDIWKEAFAHQADAICITGEGCGEVESIACN